MDSPAEFQKVMNYTLIGLQNKYCFLDVIVLLNTESEPDHINYVTECLTKLNEDNLGINLQKWHSAKIEIEWLGYKFTQEHPICYQSQFRINLSDNDFLVQYITLLNSYHI